jgi:hypothetical protein
VNNKHTVIYPSLGHSSEEQPYNQLNDIVEEQVLQGVSIVLENFAW